MFVSYYGTKYGEGGKTWAILNENDEPVPCDWRRARSWHKAEDNRRCRIKFNCIGPQKIETRFRGVSSALDGPHLFWVVRLSILDSYYGIKRPVESDAFMLALNREIHPVGRGPDRPKGSLPFQGIHSFGSREEALKFHEAIRKEVSQWLKSSHKKPELTQELLADLGDWCDQKWGRQAHVARVVGTSAQIVNDWLNGRKKNDWGASPSRSGTLNQRTPAPE